MPTYALLGATGSTGSAILCRLLSYPPSSLSLNLFVRSRSKLNDKFPNLENTAPFKVTIIEGSLDDTTAMQTCLENVDVIMACIGSNYSTPAISVVYDTATSIVDALSTHRKSQGSTYRPPTIIQLRSASLNPILRANLSWIARTIALFCFHYIYQDLERACNLFISAEEKSPGLLDYIFIDPPSIHDADGTTPTGYKLILDGQQNPVLSYADLGAAFCEVAERKDEFHGRGVGVSATGTVNETWGVLVGYMAVGARGRVWG